MNHDLIFYSTGTVPILTSDVFSNNNGSFLWSRDWGIAFSVFIGH